MNIPDLPLYIFICLMYLAVRTHFRKSTVKWNDFSVDRLAQVLYSHRTGQCCDCVFGFLQRGGHCSICVISVLYLYWNSTITSTVSLFIWNSTSFFSWAISFSGNQLSFNFFKGTRIHYRNTIKPPQIAFEVVCVIYPGFICLWYYPCSKNICLTKQVLHS